MATSIFINLPTKDLERAKTFFSAIGFGINPQFTDEKAACIVISDTIFAMILKEEFFKGFIPTRSISDTSSHSEVLIAFSADSREGVDVIAEKAARAGGKEFRAPEDNGFMYARSFEDPDGHIWEVLWMDPAFVQPQ